MIKNEKGTFLIDAFLLLPFCGILIVYLVARHLYRLLGRKKYIVPSFSFLVLSGFWIIAGGLYFDCWRFWFLSSLSGNDFMWNWPFNLLGFELVKEIPTYADFFGFLNLLAILIFLAVYPFSLRTGIQTGYILFGRSERQKGLASFFFPSAKNSRFN